MSLKILKLHATCVCIVLSNIEKGVKGDVRALLFFFNLWTLNTILTIYQV